MSRQEDNVAPLQPSVQPRQETTKAESPKPDRFGTQPSKLKETTEDSPQPKDEGQDDQEAKQIQGIPALRLRGPLHHPSMYIEEDLDQIKPLPPSQIKKLQTASPVTVSKKYSHSYSQKDIIGNPAMPEPHNLKLQYANVFFTTQAFWNRIIEDAHYTNQVLEGKGSTLIRCRVEPQLLQKFDKDILLKFNVSLFDAKWTVYKSVKNLVDLEYQIRQGDLTKKGWPTPLNLNENYEDQSKKASVHEYGSAIEMWLSGVAACPQLREDKFFKICSFLGISKPFCITRYHKVAELELYKHSQGRENDGAIKKCVKSCFALWQKRWFCLGYNNTWYYWTPHDEPGDLKDNVPMDLSSSMLVREVTKKYVIIDLNLSRREFSLKVKDLSRGLVFIDNILKAFCKSNYTKVHEFRSFAPRRLNNDCQFYFRGNKYFEEVYNLIESAKYEVMICGWMISPEMPLKRVIGNPQETNRSILMNVLKRAADERGVRVYVLVYDEFEMGLYNDSDHVKVTLEKLNPKLIKVIRHPQNLVFFWSHHEKLVLVDRKVVMLGGLDLAWGRWDNEEMPLFDFSENDLMFPGIDYYNPFIKEFIKGRLFKDKLTPPDKPRMPWQDYGIKLTGPIVLDFLTHFVTYWNNGSEIDSSVEEPLLAQIILSQFTKDANGKLAVQEPIVINEKQVTPQIDDNKMLEQDFVEDPDLIIDINVRRALREVPELRDKTIPKDNLAKRLNDIYFSAPNLKPFSAIHEKFTQTNFKAIRNVGDQALDEVPLEDPEPNFARSTLHYKTKTSVQRHKGNRITAYFSKVFSRHHATDSHISDKFIIVPKTEPEGRQEHHPVGATDNEPTKSPEKYEQQVKNENQGQLQANNANDKDKPAEPIKGPVEEKVTQQPHSIVPSDKTSIDNPKNQNLIAGNESVYRKLNDSFILDNRNQNRHIGMFNKDYKFETISEVKQPDGTMRYTIEGLEVLDDLPDYINLQSVKSLIEQTAALGNESTGPNDIRGSNLRMQALRSASHWSIGLQETEHSIQNCYLDLIDNAERFIYIENQFFISSWVKETSGNIKNLIIKALFSRILRAHREGKDFKVIVFMPLMPAAEGDLDKKGGKVLQTLMALENFTIGEGQDSLIEKIRAHCGDPAKYFMICGLRKYDYHPLVDKNGKRVIDPATGLAKKDLSGDPMTELIYIHSKLIIADDKRMLLGSANINDRSLLGYRDSELAVYIEGDLDLEFNSSSHLEHHISAQVNSTIHNFRKHIFKEHFGMAENEVIDPGHDRFWTEAWNIVKFNTMFYDYVFKIYPSNKYLTWEELAKRERGFNKKAFEELRPFVKGHAVRYPYAFLIKEALESAKNKDFGLLVAPDKILY